jgi:hypothetical protein
MTNEEENNAISRQNEILGREDFPRSRKLKSPDGTIVYVWDNKLHNWDGPARIPEGDMKRREYFLYGFQYTEDEWKEKKRNWKGVPYYKDPRFNARS